MKRTTALVMALIILFGIAVPSAAAAAEGEGSLGGMIMQEDPIHPDAPESGQEGMTQGDPAYDGSSFSDTPEAGPLETSAPEMTPEQDITETDPPQAEPIPDPGDENTPAPEDAVSPAPQETSPTPDVQEDIPTPAPQEETPTPVPSAEPDDEPSGEPGDESDTHAALILATAELPTTGQLDISFMQAVTDSGFSLSASLTSGDDVYAAIQKLDISGKRNSFKDLPAGTYTLTVSGPGFVPYTQTVDIGPRAGVLIKLTIGQMPNYTQDQPHPGVLRYGDVNGDGSLDLFGDGTDGTELMNAVTVGSGSGQTDLNRDGVTNLADAEYLAKAVRSEGMTATLERFVPASAIASVEGTGTSAQGLEDLFADNGQPTTLSRQDSADISSENPVEVSFGMSDVRTDAIILEKTNILSGSIEVEDEDGGKVSYPIGSAAAPVSLPASDEPADVVAVIAAAPAVMPDGQGNITVRLGGQIAVKRVTLTITGTSGEGSNLASISQVEFVNGMEDRIPEPEMSVPGNVTAVAGSRQFTVRWTPCQNITGYEAEVTDGTVTESISLSGTSLTVTRFNNDEVLNGKTYTVCVRSVNGGWTSPWSDSVSVTPAASRRPDKPDNVKAVGGYRTVTVSWKNMKDTTSYNLYYKEAGAAEYEKIVLGRETSYVISGLNSEVETTYEVYVTGVNEHGESPESMHAAATTTTLNPPEMPQFNLINRDASGHPGIYHITDAAMNANGVMTASSMDPEGSGTAWGTVDGDPASFYARSTWDDGGYNYLGQVGLTYTFDQTYKMDTIGVMSVEADMDFTYFKINWWDSTGQVHTEYSASPMTSQRRLDQSGRAYYFLRLPEPIEASKVQIGVARAWAGNNRISIAEVYFYVYDSLKQEINDLYADELHMTLKDTVTEEQLTDLKARIESSADLFGHVNPDKDQLLKEWETAWQILHDQFLSKVTTVHTGITASGDDHGFGGLNAWQPLGITAAAGEKITVYVGHGSSKVGDSTALQLVVTQYNAEASAMSKVLTTLKVGPNEIQIPKIWTTTGVESGGALYVQYTGGASAADDYAVRVSGGVTVPVLDLYKVTDAGERMSRAAAYLTELSAYAANISAAHEEKHKSSDLAEVKYEFDNATCILGASDIMLDTVMLSLPAQQIAAGCGGDASKLLTSLNALESMMHLFYQHKGLNASAKDAVDRIPNRHLNIRYQRMFSGAFMYAAGDHIGIGWNETAGMAGCAGVQTTESGLYQSGNYFGWGIAHEIGHNINQGCYAIAEVTNNYFSVLAQAQDNNGSVRFEYPKVYEKVTSGTKGSAGNVFTQLAMYWQLHLAYDKGYNFAVYDDHDRQLENLFFARVDTYARTPGKAPGSLTLDGGSDQILMRLCCAAAERNILDFFERWGKTPDEATVAYASQFPTETRAIYYVCDDSRRYTIEHEGTGSLGTGGDVNAIASVSAEKDPNAANKVNITVHPNETVPQEQILGYEIVRCTISAGKAERKTVGFTTESTFTDEIFAMNNRAVSYEVTLVDKYLNRSAAAKTDAVKIEHEGDLDKSHWTVVTYGLEAPPIKSEATGMDDPEVVETDPAVLAVDGKVETVYSPLVDENACIEVDFHDSQVITGFRCDAGPGTPIGGCSVDVRQNGEWLRVYSGTLNDTQTVYFPSKPGDESTTPYVSTYFADAIRLHLAGQTGETISVAELSVLGLTGDNVDFRAAEDGSVAIGYLQEAYQYGDRPEDSIPAKSLVFTGSYKGNAAYNVVMLFDEKGSVVGGIGTDGSLTARQIILADIPASGVIQDVTNGTWIYWIEPKDMPSDFALPQRVRAELYRVNDAKTNEGERLVSDSLFVDVPQPLGSITIDSAVPARDDGAVG